MLVDETNRYANEKLQQQRSPYSRLKGRRDTTVDEIFLFLEILINVGIIPLPSNSF